MKCYIQPGSKLLLWPMDYPRISAAYKVPDFVEAKLLQRAQGVLRQSA